MTELQSNRFPLDKSLYASNRKGLYIETKKKVIMSQQFMSAELNDGLIDGKS